MMKTCLIVSPYFPPSSLAGVHRARHLAKHLPTAGWRPHILAVHEDYYDQPPDHSLAALLPSDIAITKVGAMPSGISRHAGLSDIGLRAYATLGRAIDALLRRRAADIVMITGSPYYPMLLAPHIRRTFGIPVMLDFQDPWVSRWGETQPKFSKSGAAHVLASYLEPIALKGAAFVTSVSERQNDELRARYSWLDPTRMAAIPIGGDADDFRLARVRRKQGPDADSAFTFCYTGTIWPAVMPTLKLLLRSLARVRDKTPSVFARLRFRFVGTTANPNDCEGYRVMPLAAAAGVDAVIEEIPQRVNYRVALDAMSSADVNLILGSMEPHYTASKIFPILMSGTNYLSLLHRDSSAHALALRAGGGKALAFSSPAELAVLESELENTLVGLVTDPQACGALDPAAYAPFEARKIAGRFAEIFDDMAGARTNARLQPSAVLSS